MNRTSYKPTPREIFPVDTVVIHDDSDSSYTAKALLDHVAANTGGEIQFSPAFWWIDSLSCPATKVGIFRDLVRSRIVVLALHTGNELTNSVFECIESWAQSLPGQDSALVVLGNAGSASMEHLRQIAERHGITLFCEQRSPPGLRQHTEGLVKRERAPAPIEEDNTADSRIGYYRGWGLNE